MSQGLRLGAPACVVCPLVRMFASNFPPAVCWVLCSFRDLIMRELDEGDVVVATGFSCRQQIAHFTGVQAQSPAVLLEHVFGS